MIVSLQFMIILLALVSHAFFAGIETGVISIHRMRLRHFVRKGSYGARTLQEFLERPDRLLGTTLVGTNISVVIISVMSASIAVRVIGTWGEAVSTVAVSMVVLVFGEYLPKSWFHSRPLDRCSRYAGLLRLSELVFLPLSWLMINITRLLVSGPKRSFGKPAPFVTREDLKMLASEGERDGVLSPRERVMINRVFELSDKTAQQIMIPLDDIRKVDADTSIEEFYGTVRETGFTRMPVYDSMLGRFTGIINVFSVLSHHENIERTVGDCMRPPLFIDMDMPVDDIFPRLRRFRQPMSLVVDKDSNVIGLVTTENILREIVGRL